ncbi:ScbR family autoregulator-binding transcription factor [Kitasatospora sp. NPDC056783]|uniref:ScbR family autoregulator-binding transcription factor n=1 Tax=Kitasatospora sp. NPDC056783 TaxID=3345943 RepID=UPI0036D0CAC1
MVQERSERTRGRLVEAGAALFDRRGYAGATLGEIAAAAGVTKGALYFHFASKEELAGAVCVQAERLLRVVCADLRASSSPLQGLIDAGYWLVDVLGADSVIRAAFRLGREDTGWQAGAGPAGPPGQPAFAGMRGFHSVWAGAVRDLLAGARRAGELRERSDGLGPETLVVTAACGLEVVFADGCPAEERVRRVGALWDWLLPCLVPPGAVAGYRTRPLAPQPA